MGILKFTGGIALILVFGIACIMFMLTFITQNNPTSLVLSDPLINQSATQINLRAEELQALGETSKQLLAQSEPSATYVFLIFRAAWEIPLGFLAFLIKGVGTILTLPFAALFGTGSSPFSVVWGIVSALMLITVVLIILREARLGKS